MSVKAPGLRASLCADPAREWTSWAGRQAGFADMMDMSAEFMVGTCSSSLVRVKVTSKHAKNFGHTSGPQRGQAAPINTVSAERLQLHDDVLLSHGNCIFDDPAFLNRCAKKPGGMCCRSLQQDSATLAALSTSQLEPAGAYIQRMHRNKGFRGIGDSDSLNPRCWTPDKATNL